ncbi:hypothetical protein [Streptomyces avermitilis]|uniref:hypothetical protein n=1 Tax=Streptomyces avermitilis TaxID=33903 RepID=UPI003F53ED0C
MFAALAEFIRELIVQGTYEGLAVIYRWTVQRILRDATWEARAICSLLYQQKMTQKEIGDALGMTSRAVEGHMRRLRLHAARLTSLGEIDALYARIASAKAGDR